MFGRLLDFRYRKLQTELRDIASQRIGDVFAVDVRFDDSLPLSVGKNYLSYDDGAVVAHVRVGSAGADMTNPEHVFIMVEDFYHELTHTEHHAEAYRGNGFADAVNTSFNIAYLAREQDGFRYNIGYYQNAFETDACMRSVAPARDFCAKRYSGVDFDSMAVSLWSRWSKFEGARFVDSPDSCESVDDIVGQLGVHLENTGHAKPTRCGMDSEMCDYLRYCASDKFVDMWVGADSDAERNVLSAALFAAQHAGEAELIVPGVSSMHFRLGEFDVTRDVVSNMRAVHYRSDERVFSKLDIANMLRSAFCADENALVVKCDHSKTRDIVTVDDMGYRVTHVSPGNVGFETCLFVDDAVVALDRIVDALARDEMYVAQGSLPGPVGGMVSRREYELSQRDISPIARYATGQEFVRENVPEFG